MDNEVAALVARVPEWADATITEIAALEGGLTNRSYLFQVNGERYVLRVSGENTRTLGIDREAEWAAISTAAQAGLAPEVICLLRPEGHLIRRYQEGTVWNWEQVREWDNFQRVALALRRVHQLPAIPFAFDPFQDVRRRLEQATHQGIPLPEAIADLLAHAAFIEQTLWRKPETDTGLCHSDPFAGNFLLAGDTVRFIDWEYAGMGDIYYDLASLAVALPPEERPRLLELYFGHITESGRTKFETMAFMVSLWNWSWALLQSHSPDALPEHTRQEQVLLQKARQQLNSFVFVE